MGINSLTSECLLLTLFLRRWCCSLSLLKTSSHDFRGSSLYFLNSALEKCPHQAICSKGKYPYHAICPFPISYLSLLKMIGSGNILYLPGKPHYPPRGSCLCFCKIHMEYYSPSSVHFYLEFLAETILPMGIHKLYS